MTTNPELPESCGVAFKEWAGVCEALEEGRQTLILRKGGIAEGPGGFSPEHPVFWLYPTHVHEAQQGLRTERADAPRQPPATDRVALRALAVVDRVAFLDREEFLPALEPFHVWTDETVRKRFAYRKPGLWVLTVRTYRRPVALEVPVTVEHLGCKTWVSLDPPLPTAGLEPVLDAGELARRRDRLLATLGAGR